MMMFGRLFIIALSLAYVQAATEKPKYTVMARATTKSHQVELRVYEPMIIAEVEIETERKSYATSQGFRILAGYIFGGNTKRQSVDMTAPVQSQNIDMTAPVQSQNIDMTAPVQGQAAGRNSWSVSFVMPSKYTLETLPIPNDDRVTLKQVPKQMFLTIRFSGWQTDRNLKMHEKLLMMYLEQNNLTQVAPPTYADYNEPWIPGWMRRNEILIQVEEVQL